MKHSKPNLQYNQPDNANAKSLSLCECEINILAGIIGNQFSCNSFPLIVPFNI